MMIIALMFSAAAAAGGPIFSNTGGMGSATSTLAGPGREPTGGTYNIDGTNGAATFRSVGSVSVAHRYNTDFFNPGDDYARNGNLIRVTDSATGDGKIRFPLLIDNIVSSNRTNGPGQASVGLGIRSIKPNFLTSTSTQEVDGLFIQTKTGLHGDTSGILVDAVGIDGGTSFVNLIEGSVMLFDTSGNITRKIRYQGPSFQPAGSPPGYGTQYYAEKGVQAHAILIDGESPSDYWQNFVYAATAHSEKWRVAGSGDEYLAGTISARAMIATGAPPSTNTGSCATLTSATGGSAAGAFATTGVCAVATTIKLTFSLTAPSGWVCGLQNQGSATVFRQVAYASTSCTMSVQSVATSASDVIVFTATAF